MCVWIYVYVNTFMAVSTSSGLPSSANGLSAVSTAHNDWTGTLTARAHSRSRQIVTINSRTSVLLSGSLDVTAAIFANPCISIPCISAPFLATLGRAMPQSGRSSFEDSRVHYRHPYGQRDLSRSGSRRTHEQGFSCELLTSSRNRGDKRYRSREQSTFL